MQGLLIGIDIGWSKKRASCGIALSGTTRLQLPAGAKHYGRSVHATKLKLDDLIRLAATWREQNPAELDNSIVIVDGPLGPNAPPTMNRHVDLACAGGGFSRRCPPTQISSPSSGDFVSSTYAVLRALGLQPQILTGSPAGSRPFVVETNPTVALALSVRQQNPDSLPTRRRARVLRIAGEGDRVIRAKSDWYWELGGDEAVWNSLGMYPEVQEHDHERVAALTCVGIAAGLANGTATCIGDAHGTYALLPVIDASWARDVERVGVVSGTPPKFSVRPELNGILDGATLTTLAAPASSRAALDDEDVTNGRDDSVELLLCDSGGVWEAHNPWLAGCESPVKLDLSPHYCEAVVLQHGGGRARSPDQWVISPTAEVLRRALRPAYSGEPHDFHAPLSLKSHNTLIVPARLIAE